MWTECRQPALPPPRLLCSCEGAAPGHQRQERIHCCRSRHPTLSHSLPPSCPPRRIPAHLAGADVPTVVWRGVCGHLCCRKAAHAAGQARRRRRRREAPLAARTRGANGGQKHAWRARPEPFAYVATSGVGDGDGRTVPAGTGLATAAGVGLAVAAAVEGLAVAAGGAVALKSASLLLPPLLRHTPSVTASAVMASTAAGTA